MYLLRLAHVHALMKTRSMALIAMEEHWTTPDLTAALKRLPESDRDESLVFNEMERFRSSRPSSKPTSSATSSAQTTHDASSASRRETRRFLHPEKEYQ